MGVRALDGLTILVTRPEARAHTLRAMLESHGAEVVVAPTIAVTPVPLDEENEFTAAWRDRASFDWLVVVSPAIAELVVELVARDGEEGLPPCAVVGPASAAGLRGSGFEVAYQPKDATAVALATGLAAPADLAGKHIWWPRADVGRTDGVEILRGAGAEVVDAVAYRTAPIKPATEAVDRADLVLLASPSAVEGYLLGESEKTFALPSVAIGPTTAEAVTTAGLTLVGVADPHTAEGLVQAVLAWAEARSA